MGASGPYRMFKVEDGPSFKFYVGVHDIRTGITQPPRDGGSYLVDDPVLGTIAYDGEGRRIINAVVENHS